MNIKFPKIKYLFIALFFIVFYFVTYLIFEWKSVSGYIFDNINLVDQHEYAIVFGASVKNDMPSNILADRMRTAYELYKSEKIKKVLLSGYGTEKYYNEVKVMKNYALTLGFHEEDIETDVYGINTYNTCYRARKFYNINSAILVTQNYHMNRALYNCIAVGIDSVGLSSDLNNYQDIVKFKIREIPAFFTNWIKLVLFKIKNNV